MKKKQVVFIVLISLLLCAGNLYTHARMVANSSPSAFEDGVDSQTAKTASADSYTIRELVIISAGYFLKAQGNISALSEKVELSDISETDFYSLQMDAYNASTNIYYAWYFYRQLEAKADRTPYNPAVIEKLVDFDYDGFGEKNGLIKDVFKEVKSYLGKGDVRGIYSRLSSDVYQIYNSLEDIRNDLYWGKIPANEKMWNLNQAFAGTHMFGQYVARVFYSVK